MPFTIGALIHDARQQRQHRAEKLQLTLQNAALIDEQSALRERERIADELHDRLGHRLTAIEIQARLLLEHRAPAGVLDEKVAIMRTQARDALDDVRAIIQLPAMLGAREAEEAPQGKSLLQQAKDFTKAVGVQATFTFDDAVDALPFKLKYVVLRVIQEGVTNAARHAPGEPLQLSVRQNHAGVRVVMTNRTLSTSPERIGRGIPSLKRRLAQVDGSLTIQQHEDAKFKLAAFLPYSTTKEDG